MVYQHYAPNEALLTEIYENWLGRKQPQSRAVAGVHAATHERDAHELFMLASIVKRPLHTLRVLDYGMGRGAWCRTAASIGCRVFGFDISSSRMKSAAEHGITTVSESELPSLGVDFVNTEQVFEHVVDPRQVASVLASGLRRGGILKISVPFAAGIHKRLQSPDWNAPKYTRRSLNAVLPLEHLNCYSRKSLLRMACDCGLRPVRLHPFRPAAYAFLWNGGANWRSARQLGRSFGRPWYRALYPHKLHLWFRKPVA